MKNTLYAVGLICFLAFAGFFYPRLLIAGLGEAHFLSSYLYIYGFGAVFFVLGLFLLIRSRALNLKTAGEKKWLMFFILGFTWSMTAHGVWILTAVWFPFAG